MKNSFYTLNELNFTLSCILKVPCGLGQLSETLHFFAYHYIKSIPN